MTDYQQQQRGQHGQPAGQDQLKFTFEDRTVTAKPGQTIAGALHETGVRTLSRSVKYHTPRGYTCGFGACGDCPLTVNGMPGTVSCTTPVTGGEVVSREQGLPTTGFDLFRTADLMRPWLGAGFQFKLFAKQPRLSKIAGYFLAILAGGGRMPTGAAIERSRVTKVDQVAADLVVIGGAVSGLTAALAAADAGADVLVVDRDFAGGRSRVRTEQIDVAGKAVSPAAQFVQLLERAEAHSRITLVTGVAIGWIDGILPVVSGSERIEITPKRVVLATGSYEVPLLFPGHDRPGVMFADAALKLAEVEGVKPGKTAVVVNADQRAVDVAERLRAAGVNVVETVDAASVERVTGWSKATGVVVADDSGKQKRIRADLVVIAARRRPAEELALHLRYADAGSHELVERDGNDLPTFSLAVGSAAGNANYSVESIREQTAQLLNEGSVKP